MKNNRIAKKSYIPAEKMPVSERAKQFMPFAALKGFEEAIAQKEREYFKEERSLLSEEQLAELSYKASNLRENDTVTLEYYDGYIYKKVSATYLYTDTEERFILTDAGKIYFDDVRKIY